VFRPWLSRGAPPLQHGARRGSANSKQRVIGARSARRSCPTPVAAGWPPVAGRESPERWRIGIVRERREEDLDGLPSTSRETGTEAISVALRQHPASAATSGYGRDAATVSPASSSPCANSSRRHRCTRSRTRSRPSPCLGGRGHGRSAQPEHADLLPVTKKLPVLPLHRLPSSS